MRRILASSLIALSVSLAAPAMAAGVSKFQSSVQAPLQKPVKIEVVLSESMAYRANHLPKDKRKRSSGLTRHNAGFSNNGFYGEQELDRLAANLERRLAARFAKEGLRVDNNASTVLRVTIVDAQNNRPTFAQLREPGQSLRSFGNGGAELDGELISAGGQSLGQMSYKWYENDIQRASYAGTWSDAHRAFDRFARKAADSLY